MLFFLFSFVAEKNIVEKERKGLLDKYNDYLKKGSGSVDTKELDEMKVAKTDKVFEQFYKRISRDSEQILRYVRK